MGNPFGRTEVVSLTNQSGASVAAGDLVYIDTGHNDSFTTGTTSGYTGAIGIAQATIGSGSAGLVAVNGYVSLVNVNASVTRGNFLKGYTVAKQGTDAGASRGAGTCGMFLTGGTTPDAIIWQPDLGAGSGIANPGGMAAGASLSSVNSAIAWNSGTSMPGSKATGDRYWRTDEGMEFYWDGTNWLSTGLHQLLVGTSDVLNGYATGPGTQRAPTPVWSGSDIWLVSTQTWFFVNGGTALDASNKWVGTFIKNPAGTTLDTVTINSGASSTYRQSTATAINALLTSSTQFSFQISWAKTGTPGPLFTQTVLSFRYVST